MLNNSYDLRINFHCMILIFCRHCSLSHSLVLSLYVSMYQTHLPYLTIIHYLSLIHHFQFPSLLVLILIDRLIAVDLCFHTSRFPSNCSNDLVSKSFKISTGINKYSRIITRYVHQNPKSLPVRETVFILKLTWSTNQSPPLPLPPPSIHVPRSSNRSQEFVLAQVSKP